MGFPSPAPLKSRHERSERLVSWNGVRMVLPGRASWMFGRLPWALGAPPWVMGSRSAPGQHLVRTLWAPRRLLWMVQVDPVVEALGGRVFGKFSATRFLKPDGRVSKFGRRGLVNVPLVY